MAAGARLRRVTTGFEPLARRVNEARTARPGALQTPAQSARVAAARQPPFLLLHSSFFIERSILIPHC
jgi:hypothetical protein